MVNWEGLRFLVVELVEGETLADRLARGPISFDEALPLARQIAEALEASDRKGHVDLYRRSANGVGAEEPLYPDNLDKRPTSWSADGNFLIYTAADPKMSEELSEGCWSRSASVRKLGPSCAGTPAAVQPCTGSASSRHKAGRRSTEGGSMLAPRFRNRLVPTHSCRHLSKSQQFDELMAVSSHKLKCRLSGGHPTVEAVRTETHGVVGASSPMISAEESGFIAVLQPTRIRTRGGLTLTRTLRHVPSVE